MLRATQSANRSTSKGEPAGPLVLATVPIGARSTALLDDMPQSVVAFADALGTAASSGLSENAGAFLDRLKMATDGVSRRLQRIGPMYQINVRWFSDSIAMSIRFDEKPQLVRLLENLAFVQAGYAINGIFLRGAVEKGPHHHSKYVDYGPALTEAVRLERSAGPATRIILSPGLQDDVRVFEAHDLPIIEDLDDGAYFLDFLGSVDPAARPRLRSQLDICYREAKQSRNGGAVEKLSWLASYFNWQTGARPLLRYAMKRSFRKVPPSKTSLD